MGDNRKKGAGTMKKNAWTLRNHKGQFAASCIQCGEGKSDTLNEKCDNCNAYDAGEH